MFQDLWQDLRVTLRGLLRAPMMTLTIVVTVGLGIGATTVIFSAIHAALLRPLPYADAGRLVRIYTDAPPNRFRFSVADYLALQAEQTHFEQIAGYTDRLMSFSDGNVAERLRGKLVSWTYFSLLGVRPATGRDFAEADGRPGNPLAVIVSRGSASTPRWTPRCDRQTDSHRWRHHVVGVLPRRPARSKRAGLHCRPVAAAKTKDRFSSPRSPVFEANRNARRRLTSCARSTGGCFRSGGRRIRTTKRPGASSI